MNVNDLVSLSASSLYGSGSYLPTNIAPKRAAETPATAGGGSLNQAALMAYAEPFDTSSAKKQKSQGKVAAGGA